MKVNPRFHIFKRDDSDFDSPYLNQKVVVKVDEIHEFELQAKDLNDLIDNLSEARKALGWEKRSE